MVFIHLLKKGFNLSFFIIFILFIGLIISLLYIRQIIKGKRKIKANELEDNYDYIPNDNAKESKLI